MANALFYLMALGTVAAAIGVVLARNPIQSVLALLGSFFCLAVIYLLAGFQFLAAAQILVYAGAIMVLFLFVIMLLNLADERRYERVDAAMFARRKTILIVATAGALLFLGIAAIVRAGKAHTLPALPEQGIDRVADLAGEMFGRYVLPFEAISMLLLATAVAVVALAKRDTRRAGGESAAKGGSA